MLNATQFCYRCYKVIFWSGSTTFNKVLELHHQYTKTQYGYKLIALDESTNYSVILIMFLPGFGLTSNQLEVVPQTLTVLYYGDFVCFDKLHVFPSKIGAFCYFLSNLGSFPLLLLMFWEINKQNILDLCGVLQFYSFSGVSRSD